MGFSWSRPVTWVVALLVGAVYGLAGTIAHGYAVVGIPIGLVLGILGSAALVLAVRLLTADRWAALATGLGMMGATLVFSGRGPGGSVIVPESSLGVVWTLAVPIIVGLVVAWPSARVEPAATDSATSSEAVRGDVHREAN